MIEDIDYPSEKTLADWNNCLIPGCPNKCCKALDSKYCWPHTGSGITKDQLMSKFKTADEELCDA